MSVLCQIRGIKVVLAFVKFFRLGVSRYTDGDVWDGSEDSSYFCSVIF